MVTLDDIRAAADGLTGVAHRTPTERSETFTRQCGGEVWLKFENQQRTGSFKIRGAYTKIQSLTPSERAAGVVAPSAGNHAQAVAFAARSAGVDATVYMPEAASLAKVGATEGYGATVRLVGDSVEGSVEAARQAERDEGKTLVHPFDDEVVIAGQGTVGLEILEDVPDLDAIVVPLGGGGLLSGIAIAVKTLRPEVRVIGVEAAGCAPYVGSLEHGTITPVPQTETIADGIAVKHPGEITFALVREYVDDVVTVTDAEISQTIVQLLERTKAVVEGAGAVGAGGAARGQGAGQARGGGALGREHRHAAADAGDPVRPHERRPLPGDPHAPDRPARDSSCTCSRCWPTPTSTSWWSRTIARASTWPSPRPASS